ncbi:MAG TPA: hypothetical protein VMT76_07080 [Puia sp.]|nr:hypothetical protein [Puia sp.]
MNAFDIETKFEVVFNGSPVKIETIYAGKDTMYLARLTDQPALILTRASDANNARFWTSIPEGRQKLAEAIGELIADHIKKSL